MTTGQQPKCAFEWHHFESRGYHEAACASSIVFNGYLPFILSPSLRSCARMIGRNGSVPGATASGARLISWSHSQRLDRPFAGGPPLVEAMPGQRWPKVMSM